MIARSLAGAPRTLLRLLRDNWGALLLLAAWEGWIAIAGLDAIVMPHVWQVAGAILQHPGDYTATFMTIGVAAGGLALGALLGLGIAALAWFSRIASGFATAGALILTSVPVIAFVPILGRLLGYDMRSALAITALICFFPFFVFGSSAFAATPPAQTDLARVFGARKFMVLRRIIVPSSIPAWGAALKIAAPSSLLAAMSSEYLMATPGLGSIVREAMFRFETERALAASLIATILSIIAYDLAARIERWTFERWA